MDNPRQTVREILAGYGLTKPWFASKTTDDQPSMADTVLVWIPLLRFVPCLYACVECDGELENTEASHCSPRCRKRASGGTKTG